MCAGIHTLLSPAPAEGSHQKLQRVSKAEREEKVVGKPVRLKQPPRDVCRINLQPAVLEGRGVRDILSEDYAGTEDEQKHKIHNWDRRPCVKRLRYGLGCAVESYKPSSGAEVELNRPDSGSKLLASEPVPV